MNAPVRHLFEGEHLTVAEIAARVPALSESGVRALLRKGKTSVAAMLAYDTNAAKSRAGTRGRHAAEAAGLARSLAPHPHSYIRSRASGYVPRPRIKETSP